MDGRGGARGRGLRRQEDDEGTGEGQNLLPPSHAPVERSTPSLQQKLSRGSTVGFYEGAGRLPSVRTVNEIRLQLDIDRETGNNWYGLKIVVEPL